MLFNKHPSACIISNSV